MKKYYSYIACLATVLFFSICSQAQSVPTIAVYFVSDNGKPLVKYEMIKSKLHAFYGNAMPKQITVKFTDKSFSRFNPNQNMVLINSQEYQKFGIRLIAHEASHLCLNLLTKRVSSNLAQFKFLDEGMAEIMAHRAVNDLEKYKVEQALPAGAQQLQKDNLSFVKVQKWSEYFGNPRDGRWYAYDVGASFDFFIIDKFGEKKLKELFVAIGLTRDFAAAIHNTLGITLVTLEADWKVYLAQPKAHKNE